MDYLFGKFRDGDVISFSRSATTSEFTCETINLVVPVPRRVMRQVEFWVSERSVKIYVGEKISRVAI